ncbi:uncharacterized protein G2W53_031675 [Senna tora]|uniref:Uncharacterized protein n=1 Tax=Senna tora TaxID=362788 RepID=A0A834T9T5_9FABA|nr:uncharacterized protein G2W53_031675 [Senna tora]
MGSVVDSLELILGLKMGSVVDSKDVNYLNILLN